MGELDRINIAKARERRLAETTPGTPITIRVSPHSYLTAVFLGTFLSAFLFYIEYDDAAFAVFTAAWIITPFLALNDHIRFDGRSLTRTGILPRLWTWFEGDRRRLKITDIEQVETHAVRTWKRGGNIRYRYRTSLRGKGLTITVSSGGDSYRGLLNAILPRLSENALDFRSIELREYLADPKETLKKAESLRLPSGEMVRSEIQKPERPVLAAIDAEQSEEKAEELQELGNELRVAGHLARALEAFRRALRIKRPTALLIFDFARCLHSFATVEKDPRLERKALAALRLSEQRADNDGALLARIAEVYYQLGEWQRAGRTFQKIADGVGENFRAAKGLAEIALREGKIAHVIHHFAAADRVADTPALRRWAKGETEYFANLNSDDEYMEMEVSRVRLLDILESSKRTPLRMSFLSFPAVTIGVLFEDSFVANLGWTISGVSLLIWLGLLLSTRMLSRRIPYHLIESED